MESANQILSSLQYFKPELALACLFAVLLLFDLFLPKLTKFLPTISLAGIFIVGIFIYFNQTSKSILFQTKDSIGLIASDNFGIFFKSIILLTSALVIVISTHSQEILSSKNKGEFYVIVIGMTLGMFLMVSSVDLLMVYLSIEMVSLSSYILAGYTKDINRSSEASLKYLIYGAVSSGMMLYGISLFYGISGSTNIDLINEALSTSMFINKFLITFATLLVIGGIGFKISIVPFHFWTPDVYEGAPIVVTAFLSVASKAAGFAILIRVLFVVFLDTSSEMARVDKYQSFSFIQWNLIIAVFSVLSMTIGNLVALWQNNLKRMLAYSSIAHAGYILLGLVVADNQGLMAVLIYFIFYLLMNLGAFYCLMLISDVINSEEIDDFKGFGYRSPFIAVMFTIFLVSLAGLPPTAGFIGKLYIFTALLKSDWIWLAVIGILNSVVSLYYYIKIVRNMFLREPANNEAIPSLMNWKYIVVSLIMGIPTLLFGIYFQPIVDFAQKSIKILGF